MMKISLNQLVIFLAFFPYSPNLLSFTDLEPFCFLACLLLVIIKLGEISLRYIDIFWILILCASIIASAFILETMTDLRILFGGISFIIFFIYGFAILPNLKFDVILNLVKLFWVLWLIGILLQYLGVPTDILSPDRTGLGRGFTSFAPEPTFAALHIISLTTLLLLFNIKCKNNENLAKPFIRLGFVFPIFIHISATALACFLGGILFRTTIFVTKRTNFLILLLAFILIFSIFYLVFVLDFKEIASSLALYLQGSSLRIVNIWDLVITGRILEEESSFDRLSSVLFFIFSPYYFPQMINHSIWIADINNFISSLGLAGQVNYSYRNLSGLGQLNLFLGILLIFPLRGIIKACFIMPFEGLGQYVFFPVFLLALFFSTPLAHPLYGITLGLSVFVFQKPLRQRF